MAKDNCIWGTKECQRLKGRISYPIETKFYFSSLLLLLWLSTIFEEHGFTKKNTKCHLKGSLENINDSRSEMTWEKQSTRRKKNQISFTTLTFGYKTGCRHITNIRVALEIPGKIIQITGGSMTRRRIWASLIPNISLVWLVKCGMRSGGTEVSCLRCVCEKHMHRQG